MRIIALTAEKNCDICGKSFESSDKLNEHKLEFH